MNVKKIEFFLKWQNCLPFYVVYTNIFFKVSKLKLFFLYQCVIKKISTQTLEMAAMFDDSSSS